MDKIPQHGVTLAVNIINAHFGDLVAKVCGILLRKGSLNFQELARFTELPHSQLKNCLLVLIQHNCVQAFSIEREGGFGVPVKVVTHYMAIFDNILHRIRFPKFIAIIAERFDKTCEALLEGLIEHGRLTLEQVMSRAMSLQTEGNGDVTRASFIRLVKAHFVERCPAAEPMLEPPENQPPRKRAKSAGVELTVEQLALTSAARSEAERFFILENAPNDNSLDTKPGELSNSNVGKKRKHESVEVGETSATIHEKEVLWRPNFDEFIRCLRHKACVEYIRSRLDVGAGMVLETILEATRCSEEKVKAEKSVPISLDTIMQEAMARQDGPRNKEQVRAVLDKLGGRLCMGEAEGFYSIDLKSIIEAAQNAEVESVVCRRYGQNAYRIFRLLTMNGRLVETDQISGEALIDKKEAVTILYRLYKDGFLHMEKVVVSQERQVQFLLWKVIKSALWEHVLNDLYHAASNLSLRIAHELELEHEVISQPREKLDEIQFKRLKRVIQVKAVLEASLLKLDEAVMLFHDFCDRSLLADSPDVSKSR